MIYFTSQRIQDESADCDSLDFFANTLKMMK